MKAFLRSMLASLVAMLLLIAIAGVVVVGQLNKKSKIEDHSYLLLDMIGDLPAYDDPGDVMSSILGGDGDTLQRILSNLDKARVDDRIDGVVLKISMSSGAKAASMQEIRGALEKVQASGKPVYGFADSFDRNTYYLAAGCDSIYAPPTAYLSFNGFLFMVPRLAGSMEKLGVDPNLHKIKDYKSAAELLTRRDMSEFARENTNWLIDEYWDMYMASMQADRGLSEEQVTGIMELGVLRAEEALAAGLLDELLYFDQLADRLKREDDERLQLVSQARYEQEKAEDLGLKGDQTIAVIHAHGLIGGRQNRVDPLMGAMIGHESVVAEFERARRDEDIAAIIFRIDSNGGDALTSDLIGHAVERAAQDKPVVVSMVNIATSGGYHVSYRGTKIVASPTTITGSIGSISGKFNLQGLYEKLGISHDYVARGPMALLDANTRAYTDAERTRFEENHWEDFNAWLRDVAEHRNMSFEEAEKLAHGRVWTGRQAVANGLADELGGLDRAVELAKELATIPADEPVTLAHYPEKKELLDLVLGGGGDVSLALRWAIAKELRMETARTAHLLTEARLNISPSFEIR